MSRFHWPRRVLVAALASVPLLFLGACGGGGGGGDSDDGGGVGGGTTAITTANARVVAADALSNATNIEAAQNGGSLVFGVEVQAGAGTASPLQLARVVRTLAARIPASSALATGVAVNETVNCSLGGSLSINGNVANDSGLSAGDNVTLTASNCRETVDGQASQMNGSLALVIRSGSFNPDAPVFPSRVVMGLTMNNFSATVGGTTSSANGDLAIDYTATSATVEAIVLSGTALSSSETSSAGTRSHVLRNYTQSVAITGSSTSYNVTATVESTGRNGALNYQVSTPSALVTNATGAYTAGSLRVVGAASSALVLTVMATNTFQLQLDANGDGSFESTSSVTLAELSALR